MLRPPYVQVVSEGQVSSTLSKGLVKSWRGRATQQILLHSSILRRAADATPMNQGAALLAIPVDGWHLVKSSAAEVEERIAPVANQGRSLVSCNGATTAAAWRRLQEQLAWAQGWAQR